MSKTVIKKCTCRHEYQDERYGKGNRVHNMTKDDKNAYCTVCDSKVSTGGGAPVEVKAKK